MDKIKTSTMTAQYCAILAGHLPSEYQQVEYLQSESGQYIKTGFIPNQRFKTVVDGALVSDGTVLLGSWNDANGGSTQVSYGIQKGNGVFRFFNPVQNFSTYNAKTIKSPSDRERYVFVEDWITPQYKVSSYTATPDNYFPSWNHNEFFLFGRNQNGSPLNMGTMKAYSVQIYNSAGKLVLNYVPCYRKSDSKPGMFDMVSRTFVTNAGSGDFTVGGNV